MFIELDGLSLDQLINKQIEIRQKMMQAVNSGMSPGLIAQMQGMLDYISIEIKTKTAVEQLSAEKTVADENDDDIDGVSLEIG